MSYSRWSNSVWYVYGSQGGLDIHHVNGKSVYISDALFEEDEPPLRAARLQFRGCSETELAELDKYIKLYWEDR